MAKRRVGLAQRMRLLQKAQRSKWNKYTWSGLILVLVGLILIGYGLALHTGAYSGEGLAIGLGAIIVLVGIIRALIGVINPSAPQELASYEEYEATQEHIEQEGDDVPLDDQLFDHEGDTTTDRTSPDRTY